MKSFRESKGKKYHTRHIDVSTYEYDGQRIIVEGVLKDDRFQISHMVTGGTLAAGSIHHMTICLLVNCSTFSIEEIEVEMPSVPREECLETIECLSPLKGLTVTKGFTAKVKALAGGEKGCTHLVELILAMAPAVIQGYAAYRSSKPADRDALFRTPIILKTLINTCRTWREDGPLVQKHKEIFNSK